MRLKELAPRACEEAFRAWRAGSGPMLPYVKSTPFVSLSRFAGEMELAVPPEAAGLDLSEPGRFVVIDLPGAASVALGLRLLADYGLWPVVTFSHWYHPHGIVGDAATASLLLLGAPGLVGSCGGWCFLLDSTRYSDEPLTAERFNNQYELTEDDLPTVEELRELGLTEACLVTDGEPKEDLKRYAAYLAQGQLTVRWVS